MGEIEKLLQNLGISGYYTNTKGTNIAGNTNYMPEDTYISPDQYTQMQLNKSLERAANPLVNNPKVYMDSPFKGEYYGGRISTGLPFLDGYVSGGLRGQGSNESLNLPNYSEQTINPLKPTGIDLNYETNDWGAGLDYEQLSPDQKRLFINLFKSF